MAGPRRAGGFSAVLFDLDGTMLEVDVEGFFQTYFQSVAAWVAPHLTPDRFIPRLMESTQRMINNLDPGLTNQQAFMQGFFDGLDVPQETLMPVFDAYYREEFPKLARFARPAEGARELVEAVLESGRRAVVATSPVFPRAAILERLRWAGIDHVEFALVTTYENMHFCKPHPDYYIEIAEHLGCPPAECLMVGNDVEEDLPAQDVGMTVYLVEPNIIHRGKRPCRPDHRGPLAGVAELLGLGESLRLRESAGGRGTVS